MRFGNWISRPQKVMPRPCGMEPLEERQLMSAAAIFALASEPAAPKAIHLKPQAAASSSLDGTYSGTYNGTIGVNDGNGNVNSNISGDVTVTVSGDGTSVKFQIPISKQITLKPSVKTKFKTITISGKSKTTQSTATVGGGPTDDANGTITITSNKLTFSGDVDMGFMQGTVNISATKK
jgi:hypothetical protein